MGARIQGLAGLGRGGAASGAAERLGGAAGAEGARLRRGVRPDLLRRGLGLSAGRARRRGRVYGVARLSGRGGRGRRRDRRGRPGARLVRRRRRRHAAGAVRIQGCALGPGRAAEPQGQHPLAGQAMHRLCRRRPPRPVWQRAGPPLVGVGFGHERVPPLLVGPRPEVLPALCHPLGSSSAGARSHRRHRGGAVRSVRFRAPVRARPVAISRRAAGAAEIDPKAGRPRKDAGGRVLRRLSDGARTAVQHSAHPQSHLYRYARSAASSRAENPRSVHLRFLLRGHGRADAVSAPVHRRSPEEAQSGGTV